MKLKKFFAGVLAAAMMLTVGATAALATNTTDTTNSMIVADGNGVANATLTKKLVVAEGIAPQSMTFKFTVGAGQADAAKSVKAGTVGEGFEQPSVTFRKTGNEQFTVNTYSQNFNIDLVKLLGNNYNKVGKYAYTISEDDTMIPGITKDNRTLKMIITVVNKTSENLDYNTGYGYYVGLFNQNGSKADDFTNTYNSYSLEVKKTVEGSLGDLNENFTFTITLGKAAGKDNNYASAIVKSDNSDNDGTWTWTADGQAQKTVTLKHGQAAIISNLPVGVTYTVTENGKGAEGWLYEVTGEAVATNDVLPSITDNNNDNKVNIINDHKGVPDMGVVLDNAPYIAMLAIVAIGGVALMLNKRRRDEE